MKTWATIFNDFDVTHRALLDKLKIQRSQLEYKPKASLVKELQVSIAEDEIEKKSA